MLELGSVSKFFSESAAVEDVSFMTRAGEVTGYLGPNGSGKSMTLEMISRLIESSEGEILFRGEPIDRHRIAYKQRLGYVSEEPQAGAILVVRSGGPLAGRIHGPRIQRLLSGRGRWHGSGGFVA